LAWFVRKSAGKPGAAGRGGLTVAEMRRSTWLEPKLVCQVRFSEWTRDGHLRQPAFLGLRDDRKPKEVVREKPK
jgi:bifunctional non-homologous end joining protein LigD